MNPLDFNHREKPPQFVDVVNARIDTALTLENSTREPRAYLGGSRLGESCARKLQYEYLKVPRDPEREFNGKTLRIFAVGHVFEYLAVDWLIKAGCRDHRGLGSQSLGAEHAGWDRRSPIWASRLA